MKTRRLKLHNLLIELFEDDYDPVAKNVYYRPPENVKMKYPCIRYKREDIISEHADNISYRKTNRYQVTVIDKNPDNPVIEKLLDLPMSSYDRHYESDNLNHDIIIIYY